MKKFFLVGLCLFLGSTSAFAQETEATAEADLLYVANQLDAAVTVIDMATNEIVATVDLTAFGFSPDAKPHHIAVEADGAFWYVSLIGDGKVLKFNRDNELVGQADFETPGMMVVDPTTSTLYVGRSMMAVNPPPSIGIVDRETMEMDEIVVFFPRPHALALSGTSDRLYTASLAENSVASLGLEDEDVELSRLEGPIHTLVQFAIAPDGQTMVAGGQLSGQLLFFSLADPAHPNVTAALDVGGMPWHPTFTPDGRYVYIGNQALNEVMVIDAEKREVVKRIKGTGLAEPHGIAVRPDGRYVYVSNRNLKGTYRPLDADEPQVAEEQEEGDHGNGDHGNEEHHSGHHAEHSTEHGADSHNEDSEAMEMKEKTGDMAMDMNMSDNPDYGGTVTVIDTETNEIVKVLDLGRYPSGMGTRAVR